MLPLKKRKLFTKELIALTDSRMLRTTLSHPSYKPSSDKIAPTVDKFTLLCDYTFKGLFVKQALQSAPLTPKQIELFSTKLFTKKELSKIYDSFDLQQFVRYGQGFDIKTNKDFFVRLFLGYIAFYADEQYQQKFIKEVLINEYIFLLEAEFKSPVEKMNSLYYFRFGERPHITIDHLDNDEYLGIVFIRGVKVIAEVSNSYKYSRKKVSKAAIRILKSFELEWQDQNGINFDESFIKTICSISIT